MVLFIVQLKAPMKIRIHAGFQQLSSTKKSLSGFFRRFCPKLKHYFKSDN